MAVKVKPGMYCERCETPVAAQKQTHKARSLLLGPLTYGAAVKVGEWHCPVCGGPVIPASRAGSAKAERETRTRESQESARAAAAASEALRKEAEASATIIIGPTKKKGRLAAAVREARHFDRGETNALLKQINAGEPIRVQPFGEQAAAKLIARLDELGIEHEAEQADLGSPPETEPAEDSSTPERGGAPKVVDLIRELGELRKEGLLTEAEFEAKKAALIERL